MEDGTRGEYLPCPAPSAPHHLTHPSGLVSSSLFSRFHSCPLAAKPRPRLVDHAPIDQYISNRLTAGHSLFPILYHNNQLDQRPAARSFPGLNLRTSHDQPSTKNPRHILSTVSVAADYCPPHYDIFLQLPVTKEIPLSDSRPTVRHDVHKRNHDSRRQTRQ